MLFLLPFLAGTPLAAEEQVPDYSQMTTAELVKRALEISKLLEPALTTQLSGWSSLKSENEALRKELEQLRSELEQRANEATLSASELSEARQALERISVLVGNSSLSWKSSIDAVDQALKEAAKKQQRTELAAWCLGAVATGTTIWAIVETILREAGR